MGTQKVIRKKKTVQDLGEVMKRDQEKNNLLGHENQNLVNVHVGGFCHDHQNRLKDWSDYLLKMFLYLINRSDDPKKTTIQIFFINCQLVLLSL